MSGSSHDSPAIALRSALACPYPELRRAAERVILRALRDSPSLAQAAEALGVGKRTLYRIREEYPALRVDPGRH